jgi:hypothetical protein
MRAMVESSLLHYDVMAQRCSVSSLVRADKCGDWGDSMIGKLPARSRKERKRGASEAYPYGKIAACAEP